MVWRGDVSDMVRRVVDEELVAVPEQCRTKGSYLCYILRSVVTPARTYSGSTNDFLHRIRQHNGLLAGGACATKTSRPWRVAALVYGFSGKSAALRYEWFTKIKHGRGVLRPGLNSLQRRAALMMAAEMKMKPQERVLLRYHLPDYLMRRYVAQARDMGVLGTLDSVFKAEKCVLEKGKEHEQDIEFSGGCGRCRQPGHDSPDGSPGGHKDHASRED